ncbi:hypothetical protein Val02_40600 [Virgisporangium aliadipatigenens]|uniref:Uncharacterized protein n=1 Tax=Virgisporangium aliadipatigenens TaxID=741659 RepID=A0A8J3YKM2_9ACTN|nr:DUF6412 domain-containing protein [Virgisporangium aliadipatigenens]GIJ47174.1 hypothetical protein Val02_40600 [Virgisporangium aliadipatigenens]
MLTVWSTIWAGAGLSLVPTDGALSSFTALAVATLFAAFAMVAVRRAAATRPVPVPVRRMRTGTAAGMMRTTRLCDPDAAGRPRPRAPGSGPAA